MKNNIKDNLIIYALDQYGLKNKSSVFIGHNENMTFNIDNMFLLRIHKSCEYFNSDFMYENYNKTLLLNTEAEFLKYLEQNNLIVPYPVLNKNSSFVSELEDELLCTMLEWIDGNSIDYNNLSIETCQKIGTTIGRLHNVSDKFNNADIFNYDTKFCDILQKYIDLSLQNNYLNKKQHNLLSEFCNIVKKHFMLNKDNTVIIHGDLSLSNLLICNNDIGMIDFSLMGYGDPAIDISCIYSFITNPKLREAFNEGYISQCRNINYKMVNICYGFNELMGIMLHIKKLHTEDWFDEWFNKLSKDIFIPLINGNVILQV